MDNKEIKLDLSLREEEKEPLTQKESTDPKEIQTCIDECKDEDPTCSRIVLQVYSQRWIVLFVVSLLNNINTISWIAYAAIANYADSFYNFKNASNYFSMIYILCTIPVGFFAMWADRSFGLRWSIITAAFANGIGGTIRFISSFLPIDYRFIVGIIGQGIAGLAYPFIMFLPTKVAAAWFPENQRALATTIGVMSNPLGVVIANLLGPLIVKTSSQIVYINAFTATFSILALFIALFGVNRNKPKLPPTISASQPSLNFLTGLKKCFTTREFLIILIVMGGGIGMFNCLYTIIQQLLCPTGYSNTFSGLCASLMIIGGIFGATGSGIFVDKTKLYKETMKVAMSLAVIFGIIFLQLVLYRNLNIIILIVCFFFGVFGLATYPVGLEMSAECTYPVSETTSTGFVVLSGQIQSIIFLSLMNTFAKPLQPEYIKYQVCTVPGQENAADPKNMAYSNIIMSVIAASLVFILILFFHPKLLRSEAEQGNSCLINNSKVVNEIDKAADTELDLTSKEIE